MLKPENDHFQGQLSGNFGSRGNIMAIIGITGGTGLVGSHVAELLVSKGHEVVILTRSTWGKVAKPGYTYALWDADAGQCDARALEKINAIVHLAGEPIADKRWTKSQKQKIRDSRVVGTSFLVSQLKEHAPKCRTFIGASAMGFYGPDNGVPFTEDMPAHNDFLGETCRMWEHEEQKAAELVRTVILRFSIVFAQEGGAFPKFVQPLSFGVKPKLGNGRQVISWIHIADLARLIAFSIENEQVRGIYNAATNNTVTNRELMDELAVAKGRVFIPVPAPSWALKIVLGEMSIEVLKSCTLNVAKTMQTGFVFNFPDVKSAVKDLVRD